MKSRRLMLTPALADRSGSDSNFGRGRWCPLWVKSRHMQRNRPCLLYPL